MLVMMMPGPARDGTAKSVLAMAHQGVAADRQGAAIDRSCVAVHRLGGTADCWSSGCCH
jgi:hypothetical protein